MSDFSPTCQTGTAGGITCHDAGARAWTDLLATLEKHLILAAVEPGMLVRQAKGAAQSHAGPDRLADNLIDRAASYLAIATGTEAITAEMINTSLRLAFDAITQLNDDLTHPCRARTSSAPGRARPGYLAGGASVCGQDASTCCRPRSWGLTPLSSEFVRAGRGSSL